ncbi:MAG: hypothetical protein IJV76_11500 [Clostridia bacterium]|nr:hypothetical protein [Clostridia bacterium]
MSSLFFGILGVVWIIAGAVSFGWVFSLVGVGMIAAAFATARVSRKAERSDYGTPVPLSPKHYVPPIARLAGGMIVGAFGIVWMIAVFRMGGGWFALFGLMFVFAGIVQAWGFFRR